MTDDNKKVENFVFKQLCYCDINDTYEFYCDNGKYFLKYTGMKNFAENLAEVSDFNSFNKTVLSVINPWRRKYYPDTPVCDGLVWELKIKLSNKKYFSHYMGHHKTPLNYYNLEKFLDGFFAKENVDE